ncbi:MAG: phosphatidate cytidylyltransferase [Deltaproteobacteria bacterium]|nr:phosphatidate cytidylyltransferase [Deltaproteobacteria bacterium]MBW1920327.1 phosphatidate cytidylyltransferase [Deltaproteobacteria bacterium]MBW1935440.1 phosphatidate cytidylyltransferase [Deltaproteobacteria bacterium]MBW1977486.1 phosphatidate cytidylyltransferase [Deltaproteobacteria bacterium]MBW2044671.1 phosphatidate cytidylyltransferase [Deltaproteobacteria bacterium]
MSDAKRWLTGIIAVPILILVIGPGPRWLFHILVFVASTVGLHEFYKIAAPKLPAPVRILSFFLSFFFLFFISRGPFFMSLAMVPLWAIFPVCFYLFGYYSRSRHSLEDIGKTVLGLIYVCTPLALLIVIDKHPRGNIWIFFLMAVIFLGDTGAFYVGRALGKHKLYRSISPGKTWEGALGGVLSAVVAALVFPEFFSIYKVNSTIIVLAIVLSICGQIGDLAESMLKRTNGVKDSGSILPGHGGLLDRIDGLLFSIPVLYLFLSWSIR